MNKSHMRKKSQVSGAGQAESTELARLRLRCSEQAVELEQLTRQVEASDAVAASARHGLAFAQDEWKLRLAEAQSDIARVKSDYALLEQDNAALAQDKARLEQAIGQRFEELATLTKLLVQQQAVEDELANRVAEIADLVARNTALKTHNAGLEQRLAMQDAELQKLAQRSAALAASVQVPVASGKTVVNFLAPWSGKERREKERRTVEQQLTLLRASGLFDEAWYCAQYPDVEKTVKDPALHYLLHGAAEGRDPGPLFSTRDYCSNYPDVAASNLNPLLHYIRFGGKEGRLIRSAI